MKKFEKRCSTGSNDTTTVEISLFVSGQVIILATIRLTPRLLYFWRQAPVGPKFRFEQLWKYKKLKTSQLGGNYIKLQSQVDLIFSIASSLYLLCNEVFFHSGLRQHTSVNDIRADGHPFFTFYPSRMVTNKKILLCNGVPGIHVQICKGILC